PRGPGDIQGPGGPGQPRHPVRAALRARPGPAHALRRPRRVERGLPGPGRPGLSVTTVTILGAGAMGSALATPAVTAGNRVRLWGTWLDGDLLAARGGGHPHTPPGVTDDPVST